MAIDFEGIMLIFGLTAMRLAVPIVVMVTLCKVLPICFPYDTPPVEN